jgi:hypothetical protein
MRIENDEQKKAEAQRRKGNQNRGILADVPHRFD